MSLAEARDRASTVRLRIRDGNDPVEDRKALRISRQAMTFEQAARAWHASKSPEYRNAKHAAQILSTLETYTFERLGDVPVANITLADVTGVLLPIWDTKMETASRLRSRMERVLAWSIVSGHRTSDNPARWKGNLDAILPAPGKIHRVRHHRALPVDQVPAVFARVRAMSGMPARALQFLILTAARSGEVRGATWGEVSEDSALWIIPAARMKADREHRVPLSAEAQSILTTLPRFEGCPYIFASARGRMLSDMSISAVMRRMGEDAVPHGFRSTFRDWAAEHTDYPGELAEMALAHAIGNKVEAAYRRGDLLEKRRAMMEDWAALCARQAASSHCT